MMKISLEAFQLAVSKIMETASRDGGKPVCLCAADDSGCLIGLLRMDGAPRRLAAIASGKAYTAARMCCSTTDFRQRLLAEGLGPSDFCDARFTSLPGGIPILSGAECLGAVAVSGRRLDEDQALAQAFAGLLRESLGL